MATSKSAKIQGEIDKAKAKISEAQARLRELEQKHKEAENEEIVDVVRGMSIPLDQLPVLLQKLKSGEAGGPAPTSGQNVQKSTATGEEENNEE